jgi:hypothetical protein
MVRASTLRAWSNFGLASTSGRRKAIASSYRRAWYSNMP